MKTSQSNWDTQKFAWTNYEYVYKHLGHKKVIGTASMDLPRTNLTEPI